MGRRALFKFRLYVAADTLNSAQAVANLNALCHAHLTGRYEIEVVDVFEEPQRALAENIRMTPTLLKLEPSPARRIVGSLSKTELVLDMLGLEPRIA
ncbi:MAG: circadian clock KaiB family protein [Pseudomonadota bacterium]|nr:circadian clock KaiB family protein [Pseudomonadota bacterium]